MGAICRILSSRTWRGLARAARGVGLRQRGRKALPVFAGLLGVPQLRGDPAGQMDCVGIVKLEGRHHPEGERPGGRVSFTRT